MTIHEVDYQEVPRLLELGRAFFEESKAPGKWNPDSFVPFWTAMIRTGYGVILVLEVDNVWQAVIGGGISPDANTGDLVALEAFYFAFPEFRGKAIRLFPYFENLVRERGAKRIAMACLSHLNGERMGKWYEHRGYRKTETFYIKEF